MGLVEDQVRQVVARRLYPGNAASAAMGRSALVLARRVDSAGDMQDRDRRNLRLVLEQLAECWQPPSGLDDIRARRALRLAGLPEMD